MSESKLDIASSRLKDDYSIQTQRIPQHMTCKTYPSASNARSIQHCRTSLVQTIKDCISIERPRRIKYNKTRRRGKVSTKNLCIPSFFFVALVRCLHLFPTFQFLNAFRMERHSVNRFSGDSFFGRQYGHKVSLLATQNQNGEFQRQQEQQRRQQMTQKDPFEATGQEDLFKTLAGGLDLIFEMAAKSMLFNTKDADFEAERNVTQTTLTEQGRSSRPVQGRWYPHSGIADVNPNFRTQAPAMTNKGFAKSIWKNARKRNKPSLWKHALRTYDRMALLENDPNFAQIQRSNVHHEGAMVACAKLGLWQRALEIYHYVNQEAIGEEERKTGTINRNEKGKKTTSPISVTDDMVLSLVRATVRASRLRSRKQQKSNDPPMTPEQEEQEAALRRIPLDTALEILSTLHEDHDIPVVAYYLNPLAAAYQNLGYTSLSKEVLETMLSNRTAGEDDTLNVHDLCAKDKGSYSLLVQASVVTGDWGSAVDSLSEMTKAGIYPNSRHCNIWSEISERHTRPRAVGSWKKKRDDLWTDSIR